MTNSQTTVNIEEGDPVVLSRRQRRRANRMRNRVAILAAITVVSFAESLVAALTLRGVPVSATLLAVMGFACAAAAAVQTAIAHTELVSYLEVAEAINTKLNGHQVSVHPEDQEGDHV